MSLRSTALALGSALVATAAAGLALVSPGTASAATVACTVDYTTNDWGVGFNANVKINNVGTQAVNNWVLTYAYTGNQTLSGTGWGGVWSQSGKNVTITAPAWATSIPAGGNVTPGASFSYSGTNAAPTAFAVNGLACTGSPVTGSPSASASPSPSASASPSPSASASASASPSASASASPSASASSSPTATGSAPALHVAGTSLVDGNGKQVTLHGVNRSGTEFMCVQGYGFFDGPADAASINAIKSWHVNAVRVPLNEDCWIGTSNVNAAYAGANYRTAIKNWVDSLRNAGLTPIVEMHWSRGQYTGNSSGCSDVNATCQKPMPGANAVPFWQSVADTFKDTNQVVFDLFNEPYADRSESSTTQAWLCWRDGSCPGIPYQVSGFQKLVDTVRATGSKNVILLGGLAYSNDLSQWLTYKPTDPTGNLAAAFHVYNFNTCSSTSCFDSTLAPVAAQVPLVAGEIGENTCSHGFIDQVMSWFDAKKLGYLGWTWNTWDCSSGPSLISNFDGTPTNFGVGLRDHFLAIG